MEHDTYLLLHEILREIKHMTSTVVDQVKLAHDEQKAAVTVLQGQVTAAVNELKALKDALTAAITAAQSIGPADAAVLQSILDSSGAETAAIVASSQTLSDAVAVNAP